MCHCQGSRGIAQTGCSPSKAASWRRLHRWSPMHTCAAAPCMHVFPIAWYYFYANAPFKISKHGESMPCSTGTLCKASCHALPGGCWRWLINSSKIAPGMAGHGLLDMMLELWQRDSIRVVRAPHGWGHVQIRHGRGGQPLGGPVCRCLWKVSNP